MTSLTYAEISAAANRLSASGVNAKIDRAGIPQSQLTDLHTLVAGAGEIAKVFGSLSEIAIQDYDPGILHPDLCRRFSELPAYKNASKTTTSVVRGLGYEEVIGIFFASGQQLRDRSMVPSIGPLKWREFLEWMTAALVRENIAPKSADIAQFKKFANLTHLLRYSTGIDSFGWLNQPSGHSLRGEPILASDCTRLLQIGIKITPDLAQTSVYELTRAFANDSFALGRLRKFLDKRDLAFGMKFRPEWK